MQKTTLSKFKKNSVRFYEKKKQACKEIVQSYALKCNTKNIINVKSLSRLSLSNSKTKLKYIEKKSSIYPISYLSLSSKYVFVTTL